MDIDSLCFEQASVGLALNLLESGEFHRVNQAFADIVGWKKSQIPSLDYYQLTPRKYQAAEEKQLESLKRRGCYGPYDKHYIHKDGHLVEVHLNGWVAECNGEKYIYSVVEGLTGDDRWDYLVRIGAIEAVQNVDLRSGRSIGDEDSKPIRPLAE